MNILEFIFFLQLNIIFSKSKLISVFTLNRHGTRAPITIDSDLKDYFGNFWPNKGKLTSYGERMLYILGIHKRYKYLNNIDFLNKTCDPHEIYFFSSNYERTIMSAQSQILGLCSNSFNDKIIDKNLVNITYPPIPLNNNNNLMKEIEELNKEKFSLPSGINLLPVHISDQSEGKFLITMTPKCRKVYRKLLDYNLKNHIKLLEMEKIFNGLYRDIFNKLHNENKYYNFHEIFDITDQYITSLYDGKNVNEVLKKNNIDPEEFLTLSHKIHYYFILYYLFGDEKGEGYKLEVSLLLRDAVNHIKNNIYSDITGENKKIKTTYDNPKFMIGNGHDSTIMGIELFINEAFQLSKDIYSNVIDISYAGSLTFEVIRDNKQKSIFDVSNYFIDYYINDQLIKRFNFTGFTQVIEQYAWTEEKIDEYCSVENYVLKEEVKVLKNIIIILISCIVVCVFLLYNNHRTTKKTGTKGHSKKDLFLHHNDNKA